MRPKNGFRSSSQNAKNRARNFFPSNKQPPPTFSRLKPPHEYFVCLNASHSVLDLISLIPHSNRTKSENANFKAGLQFATPLIRCSRSSSDVGGRCCQQGCNRLRLIGMGSKVRVHRPELKGLGSRARVQKSVLVDPGSNAKAQELGLIALSVLTFTTIG